MEAVPMPVALLMGPDHRFQFANDSYRNFFLSDKSYVGKSVQELMPQADSEGLVSLLNNVYETGVAFKGNESHFQFSPSPEVQQSLYMNFVYEPMRNESGDTIGVIAAISDVTEQVASKKDLEKERDMREKFVATLTHDLRTPLTAAKISAQLLARKGDDLTSIHKFTGRIVSNMERADHMIRDLLDANRITAGETLPLELSQFSLDHLIREVVEEMGAIYGDRFEYSSGKKIEGSWSYSGLRRVLENLCGNAVKYGASDSPVRISTSTSGGFVSIEVWNRGNPIDKSHIDNLFKAYIRSNRLQDATQKGWGLGLTLVKGLVEAHGGEISVTSHAESGTSFVAKLPIQASVLV
jgi:signal transduction histidine kinase